MSNIEIRISLDMMRDGFGNPIRCVGRLVSANGSVLAISEGRDLSHLLHNLSIQIDGPDVTVGVSLKIKESSYPAALLQASLLTQIEGWDFERSRAICADLLGSAI